MADRPPREGRVMNQQTEELHLYFTRVRPMCRELFSMAFAICADYDCAELALEKVILGGWQNRRSYRSSRGFRDSLRADMRREALNCAPERGEDWDQLASDPLDEQASDPVLSAIQQENALTRRVIMLKYGCLLKNGQIARLVGTSAAQIEQLLSRFQRRLRRRLSSEQRGKLDARLKDVCLEQLQAGGVEMPDIGALYRNFEAEASASYNPVSHFTSHAVKFAFAVALMLALGCVIWGISAIIRPAQIENTGLMTETLDEQ